MLDSLKYRPVLLFISILLFTLSGNSMGEETQAPSAADAQIAMSNARLDSLIRKLDEQVKGRPGFWQFIIEQREVYVITDEKADRMRIISPVAELDTLKAAQMKRLLQANFDSALDARYAIAKELLWSAYLHPLTSLQDKQFLGAIGQVVNLATTFGSSYSSGALIFRGGDSEALQRRKLIEDLIDKGLAI